MPADAANFRAKQDQVYCVANGYKEQVRCVVGLPDANVSDHTSGYLTFQGCSMPPGDVMHVLRFELVMLLCFVLSFSFVTKRKRKAMIEHQRRIAQYFS